MENALKAKPEDIRERYESQLNELREAYGEAMLGLRARKNGMPCWARRTRHDPSDSAGLERRRLHRSDDEALSLVRCSSSYGLLQARESKAEGAGLICDADQTDDRGGTFLWLSDGGKPSAIQQEHRSAGLPADELAALEKRQSDDGNGGVGVSVDRPL